MSQRSPIRLDPEAFPEENFRVSIACLTDLLAEAEHRAKAARLALDEARDAHTARSNRDLAAAFIEIDEYVGAVAARIDGAFRKITYALKRADVRAGT